MLALERLVLQKPETWCASVRLAADARALARGLASVSLQLTLVLLALEHQKWVLERLVLGCGLRASDVAADARALVQGEGRCERQACS
jgi:hypothetical protein